MGQLNVSHDSPLATYGVGDPAIKAVYLFTLKDVPGVVASNNFLSIMNPVGSGVTHVALAGIVSAYASGSSTTLQSLTTQRITSASGGTAVAPGQIGRFFTGWADPKTTLATGNPTVTTLTGQPLSAFAPPISTGNGAGNLLATPPPGASFVLQPGEGLVWNTAAGNVNQVWSITYLWYEK